MAILGVSEHHVLGHRDGALEPTTTTRSRRSGS
jgi:hypothetical protein